MNHRNALLKSMWELPDRLRITLKSFSILALGLIAFGLDPSAVIAASKMGKLSVAWGDPESGTSIISYSLALDGGEQHIGLVISDELVNQAGGIQNINGQSVVIEIADEPLQSNSDTLVSNPLVVTSMILLDDAKPSVLNGLPLDSAVSQNRPYVSILCKFSDIPNEPQNLAFFSNMYGSGLGGLNHYWKEVTSDLINVAGSTAHGWYTLPYSRAYYIGLISGSSYSTMLSALFADCTSAADNDVDFSSVFGINLMFNDTFGSYAWGGSRYATLDGVSKSFPTTWEPPWGWANVTVMAHEMGHSFGLPHSNNSDQDTSPYDNPWTVMSDTWSYTYLDPASVYGIMGQHPNAYDKLTLGSFTASETFTHLGPFSTIILEPQSKFAASSSAYRVGVIPVNTASIDYYTVEVRDNSSSNASSYEGLPSSGVIIHAVKHARTEPAWLIDGDTPVSGGGDTAGVVWTVGEVFEDATNGVRVSVDAQIGESYQISLGYGTPELTSPVTGSILSGTTETFQWTSAPTATAYRLWLGSTSGGKEYGAHGYSGTSVTVSGLPADGSTVFATLKWNDGSSWYSEPVVSYTATTGVAGSVITSPVPGSTLAGASEVFQWNSISGANIYRLWVGSSSGGKEHGVFGYSTTNELVGLLPTDGSTVYVTLKWHNGSNWQSEPTVSYTAATISTVSWLTSHLSGDTLAGSSDTFQWSAISGASIYRLWLGSTSGGKEYGAHGYSSTSVTVSGMPTDGSAVYATLKWHDGNSWASEAVVALVASTGSNSVITSPVPGSTLNGSSETFQWSSIGGASIYRLWVGSSAGGKEHGVFGYSSTSEVASGLPTDGSEVYVTLRWYDGSAWQAEPTVSYTAFQ